MNVVLPVIMALAIGWYFYKILSKPELRETSFSLRVEWLLPAALLYLAAHSIWGCFWITLLRNQGVHVSYPLGLRGYFVSQYGKYIPGKIWVIFIRMAMLSRVGANRTIVGITATYEALISMGSGAMIGVLLLPLVGAETLGLGDITFWLLPVAVLPLGLGLLNRLIVRRANQKRSPGSPLIPRVPMILLLRGLLQASLGWALMGLSLWMTIQGLQPETTSLDGELFLRLMSINCLAYVLGFVAIFMPAGGGVREIAMQTLLALEFKQAMGEAPAAVFAAVVSLVIRLIWTIAELVLALSLQRFVSLPPLKSQPLPDSNGATA